MRFVSSRHERSTLHIAQLGKRRRDVLSEKLKEPFRGIIRIAGFRNVVYVAGHECVR
jgi:hypothetical protein